MRILFLNIDRRHTCSFYRSGGVSKDLANKLHATIDVMSWNDMPTDWQTLANYDLVMIQRPYTDSAVTFCKHIKQLNIPLWLDYDDNLFCVTPENRAWPVFNDPTVQKYIKEMISMADAVSVTNAALKQELEPLNKYVTVVPNAFNDIIFDVNRKLPKREKTVLWRGSDTHIFDLMEYTAQIANITSEFKDWNFKYIGYNPWFLPTASNISFTKALDIIDYFNEGFRLAPSVVQVPLVDTLFNRCKSDIAFIEGTYWGAVCVVPEWWGVPALLYKDKAGYYEALKRALSGDDIDIMNEQAWDYVRDNLLLSSINEWRVEIVNTII